MHPLPPRAHYLAAPVTRPDKASLSPEEVLERGLPPAVTAVTGPVHAVTLPPQGVCSAVLRLQADKGTFLVKVARGWYRQRELWAEHQVMNTLHGRGLPVPASLALVEAGDLSYQVRSHVAGEPLRAVLSAASDRAPLLAQMAQTLAAIHGAERAEWTWAEWLEASLSTACRNLETAVYDPEDSRTPGPAWNGRPSARPTVCPGLTWTGCAGANG